MLAADRTIHRFTPAAGRLLNLLPSDVGRNIAAMNFKIDVPDLNQLLGMPSAHGDMRSSGAIDHRNFVTAVQARAGEAIFENLFGQIFAAYNAEAEVREKFWNAREQADAVNAMPACFLYEREHDLVSGSAFA